MRIKLSESIVITTGVDFSDILGKNIIKIAKGYDSLIFYTDNGIVYEQCHHQNCCESVAIEDITGDLDDLIGSPILVAEESSNDDTTTICGQWTFYKLATNKGWVDIRWYGSSNGYYSVGVSFDKTEVITTADIHDIRVDTQEVIICGNKDIIPVNGENITTSYNYSWSEDPVNIIFSYIGDSLYVSPCGKTIKLVLNKHKQLRFIEYVDCAH